MISVDDHLIEPPGVWEDRLPAKYRDEGPRWISDEVGEYWRFEGKRYAVGGAVTAGAFPVGSRPLPFMPMRFDEIPAACRDPAARVEAMNIDKVAASLIFPNLPGFAGALFQNSKDRDLALLCIQAYNDWLLDEWCGRFPDRFIGLALIPMFDARLAAREAERVLAKGARAVAFSLAPQNLGFPGIHDHEGYWDPLFAVMNEADLPLCSHLGTQNPVGDTVIDMDLLVSNLDSKEVEKLSGEIEAGGDLGTNKTVKASGAHVGDVLINYSTNPRVQAVMAQFSAQAPMLEWLASGNFDRFPNLKVVLSEDGIGWMPPLLGVADWLAEMSRSRVTQPHDAENSPMFSEEARTLAAKTIQARGRRDELARLPSEIFRDHIYGCFINDPVGIRLLDLIGEDNVMIETDFPHNATWFPHSMDKAMEYVGKLEHEVQRKVLRGNAERVFRFQAYTPALTPV